ncbi:MAG: NrsF family protein [Pseudomonadota bacterium]|jgi:hypothetical protein
MPSWAVPSLAALSSLMTLGFRPDIVEAAGTYRFLFKFIFTATLTVSAIALMFRIRRPEAALGRWLCLLAIAPAMLMAAATAELLVMPSSTWMPRMIGANSRFCLTVIPLLSIVPLCAFLTALHQTSARQPWSCRFACRAGRGWHWCDLVCQPLLR